MAIYLIRFTTWGSWSLLSSFFAVWLSREATFSPADISLLAATIALANRAGGLVFVPWIGRWRLRRLLVLTQLAIILAAAGLQWLYSHGHYRLEAWLPLAAMFGVAHSLASLAQLTYLAAGGAGQDQVRAFSMENVALNLSAGVTPFLSALVLDEIAPWYLMVPVVYCLATLALTGFISDLAPAQARAEPRGATSATSAKALGMFLLLNALSFFAFSQFYNVFPFFAREQLSAQSIGLWFALSSGMIVLLQLPLTRLLAARPRRWLVIAANGVMGVGVLGLLQAAQSVPVAFLAVLCLTLAEMVFGPLYQVMVLGLMPGRPAFAMGLLTLTWASAEAMATGVGLYLVAEGQATLAFGLAACACLGAVSIGLVFGRLHGKGPLSQALRAPH